MIASDKSGYSPARLNPNSHMSQIRMDLKTAYIKVWILQISEAYLWGFVHDVDVNISRALALVVSDHNLDHS